MTYIRVTKRYDENYDVEINFKLRAENVSKVEAFDWMESIASNCDTRCEEYEIVMRK